MNLPEKNFTAETHTAPPSSWVEMTAEAMASMLSNGAKLPLVVEDGEAGSIVVMELSRHPILSKHPARWNAAEWAASDKSRLLTGMLDAWERMHTALAGDPETDPDAIIALADAKDALLDAANDFCAAIGSR